MTLSDGSLRLYGDGVNTYLTLSGTIFEDSVVEKGEPPMGDLIPLKEAQERVNLSKNTLNKLIERHGITVYQNPRDARQKLVDIEEVENALRPVLIRRREDEEGKAAA